MMSTHACSKPICYTACVTTLHWQGTACVIHAPAKHKTPCVYIMISWEAPSKSDVAGKELLWPRCSCSQKLTDWASGVSESLAAMQENLSSGMQPVCCMLVFMASCHGVELDLSNLCLWSSLPMTSVEGKLDSSLILEFDFRNAAWRQLEGNLRAHMEAAWRQLKGSWKRI